LTNTREFQRGTLFFGFFLTDIPNNIYNSLLLPMAELPNPTTSFPPSQSGFGLLDQEFRGEYKTPQQLMGISAVFVHPATKYSVAL
jgi:hypothetical protein